MYARRRTGVVLYVLSSLSLYACVCERLFLSVVMTVVLGQRRFDSLHLISTACSNKANVRLEQSLIRSKHTLFAHVTSATAWVSPD